LLAKPKGVKVRRGNLEVQRVVAELSGRHVIELHARHISACNGGGCGGSVGKSLHQLWGQGWFP
jgi:hypothetical protein